jgi:hypothetical protein
MVSGDERHTVQFSVQRSEEAVGGVSIEGRRNICASGESSM